MNVFENNLVAALSDLKGKTIGLMKNPYTGNLEPIVVYNGSTFTTVTIGNLLGSSFNQFSTDDKKFSNRQYFSTCKSKTLADMGVFELQEFVENFNDDNK